MNVILNQRHLVAALAIALGILYFLLCELTKKKSMILWWQLGLIGIAIGLLSRVHTLIFVSLAITLFVACILYKKYRFIPYIFMPALLVFAMHAKDIIGQQLSHPFFHLGFLTPPPFSLYSFLSFWSVNLGIAIFLLPLGIIRAKKRERIIFFSILPLFLIGNIFQLSYRIDHNHSLFNFFIIYANFYIAFFLTWLWKRQAIAKIVACILFILLTASGILNLMAVKNDFRYPISLGGNDTFVSWINNNTRPNTIILGNQEILDPITLSGRKNYLGHQYYREVMGYDSREREELVKSFFEASSSAIIHTMRSEHIEYVAIPINSPSDFLYHVNETFFKENLPIVYKDGKVIMFKL